MQTKTETKNEGISRGQRGRVREWLRQMGPGFITGASDDDPSGIATYSQAGAQFGSSMLWSALLSFPFMAAIQEISARIGRVTGRGLAGNIGKYYSRRLLYPVVLLILVSNTINLGADIGAMAAALELLVGKDRYDVFPFLFGLFCVAAQVLLPYRTYTSLLKWLSLSLLSYVAVLFAIDIPWPQVLRDTFIPRITLSQDYLMTLVAVLGTTISPYLFFWQSSQEVEEQQAAPDEEPLRKAPEQARAQFQRVRLDTYAGMAISNTVAYFIILTAAVSLHANGITHIATSSQAAEALRPIAGSFAFALFSIGIIGTGLLAVPVLAGSVGYAVGEALKWPTGLDRKPYEAKGFYFIIGAATLIGTGLNIIGIDPIKALFLSAVINGVVSVPVLFIMMRMASKTEVMGKFVIPRHLRIAGWVTTGMMAFAALALMFVAADVTGR